MTSGGGAERPHVSHVASSGSGRLLQFLQGYPNPLARLTGSGKGGSGSGDGGGGSGGGGAGGGGALAGNERKGAKLPESGLAERKGDEDGGGGDIGVVISENAAGSEERVRGGGVAREYPLSRVMVVGVICFLMGSLLRSLVSPGDFVYSGESRGGEGEWREVKGLVSLKYVLGGWDLQVAAVRRH